MTDTGSPRPSGSPIPTRSPTKRGQACERCWKRKQKCDRLLPGCTACTELEVECVARCQDISSLLAEDAGLSHASLNSYLTSLKRRVAEIENGGQSASSKRPRTGVQQDRTSDETPPGRHRLASSASVVVEDDEPLGEDSSVRDTMGAIGLLSNSAMAEPRTGLGEAAPHKLALTEVIVAALAISGHDPSAAVPSQPSLVLDSHQLPLSRENTIEHFRLFLDWAFLVPYLDHGQLLEHFEETVAQHGTSTTTEPLPLHRFNAFMGIATGIMISQDATRLSFLASSLHALAVKLLPRILQPLTPLNAVHTASMLLSYSLVSSTGGSSWHLQGLAMKSCIELGLHKDAGSQKRPESNGGFDPRWMFWTVYIFDRALSSVMDRPFSIQDTDISVQIPPESEDIAPSVSDSMKGKALASRHLIRHAQLMSSIRDNSSIDTEPMFSYQNLCFWRDSPLAFGNGPAPTRHWVDTVNQLACRTLMQIVSPTSQPNTEPDFLRGTVDEVEADTVDTCRRLIGSLYDRSGSGQGVASFIDAYDAVSAAIIFTCLLRRQQGQQNSQQFSQAFASINKALAIVTQVAGRFPSLRSFQELLLKLSSRLMEEHSERSQNFRDTLDDIPTTVPRRLRQFIRNSFP